MIALAELRLYGGYKAGSSLPPIGFVEISVISEGPRKSPETAKSTTVFTFWENSKTQVW